MTKEEFGFDEKNTLLFNGTEFSVPKDYDSILTRLYGDYMKLPPKEKRIAQHNYKAYKKQENDK